MTPSLTLVLLSALPAAPALGPPQFETVPELRAALKSDQSSRRLDAVRFLNEYAWPRASQPDAADRHQVTTDLLRLLADPVADVRHAALDVLCAWQEADQLTVAGRKAFVRALGPLVADQTHPKRVKLARRLAKLDPGQAPAAARALREALAALTTAEADRVQAAVGLAELSPDDKPAAVKALREVMTAGKDADARVDAARAVVKLEPADRPAAAQVCREVADRATGMTVLSAATALRSWKEVDAAGWTRLVAAGMERSPDPIDRGNLATALAVMRPDPKEAVPVLLRVMKGTGGYARVLAADAVLTLDPDRGPDVLPVARELLKDPEARGNAAQILGRLGPLAKDSLGDLRAALKEPPRAELLRAADRINLLTALGQVDPAGVPEAVAGLREYLRGPPGWGRDVAIGAVRRLGPAGKDLAPDLVRIARDDKSAWLRTGIAEVLGEVGRGSPEAEALLREWAGEDDPDLRAAAGAALQKVTAKTDPKARK